ncbi:MSHA biogenesis protein MshQ [hydrothermal vent metagenome]|uniref:MSHA biogenesis protein MshQ n=1 Tax=hydrothermal vent metagenome TaxID=652676 RepID=A0A3B0ZXG2_9ZZZZ
MHQNTFNNIYLSKPAHLLLLALFLILHSTSAVAWKMESRTITLNSTFTTPAFTAISFTQNYATAPLIFALPTIEGGDPSDLRIQNITNSGFEIAQVESPGRDGPHVAMTVDILVIEAGVYSLPDGTRFEAGTVTTNQVQRAATVGGAQGWETINFSSAFSATPIVLAQIQTMNNEASTPPGSTSSPWLTSVVDTITSSTVRLALERSEVNSGTVTLNETIAFIAVDSAKTGSFIDNNSVSIIYQTILSGAVVDGWDNACDNINFSSSFAGTPLVIASKATRNDSNGGWLRRCALSSSSVGLTVDEDTFFDSERAHGQEQASIIAFSRNFEYDSSFTPPPPPSVDSFWKLESAAFTMPATPSYITINFRQSYSSAPLVFLLIDNADNRPVAVRIRNVTNGSFEAIQVVAPSSTTTYTPVNVHYLAIEAGRHVLPDGTVLEAGTQSVSAIQHGNNVAGAESWATLNFNSSFVAAPTVLLQIQGMLNEPAHFAGTPSVPWLTMAIIGISNTSASIALERSEVNDGTVSSAETVAYLAIESAKTGSFTDNANNTILYETIRSSDSIVGWANACNTINFSANYVSPIVTGIKATHDGGDGGWLRRCSLSSSTIGLVVDEDTDNDTDRSHTTERASLMIFSQAFDAFIQPTPLSYYTMDEVLWDGVSSDVIDSSPNAFHALAVNGANTLGNNPALSGSPGTCRYSDLDGNNDHILLPENFPNLSSSFTITAWIYAQQINNDQRIFADDESNSGGFAFSLGDGGNGKLRFFSRNISPIILDTSAAVITQNQWYFVSAVHDATNKIRSIYVDGNLVAQDASAYTSSWGSDSGRASIGGETDASGEANPRWRFSGNIDELRIYNQALTGTEINDVKNLRHPCSVVVTSYKIVHDNNGIHCLDEAITITVVDGSGATISNYTGTIILDTQTGKGSWVSSTGSGTLLDATSNDGLASYTFVTADNGTVMVNLEYQEGTNLFNIDVYDSLNNTLRDDDSEGDITFRPFGFVITPNPVTTQISNKPFSLTLTAAGQTPASPLCGTIETYTGNQNVKFWSSYIDPNNAAIAGTPQVSINGNTIATNEAAASNQTIAFNLGVATVTTNYPDAGQIQILAKDDSNIGAPPSASGDEIIGGITPFVVKPFGFDVAIPSNPQAVDHTGSAFIRSGVSVGDSFSATISAKQWSSSDDANNDGIPDGYADADPTNNANLSDNNTTPNFGNEATKATITLTRNHFHPSIANGGSAGNLSGSTSITASNGFASSSNLRYSEVGVIELSADASNYLSNNTVSGKSSAIGRFYPNHFTISGTPILTQRSDLTGCADAYSYMDENFTIAFTIEARNADNNLTSNYEVGTGYDYSYLLSSGTLNLAAINDPTGSPSTLTSRLNQTAFSGNFTNGIATANATMQLQRITNNDGPYNDLRISSRPIDSDNITLQNSALNSDPAQTGSNTHQQLSSTSVLFGRVNISPIFGSEFLNLAVPWHTEYFVNAQTGFALNTNDNCTPLNNSLVDLSNNTANPAAGILTIAIGSSSSTAVINNNPVTAGTPNLIFGAPSVPGYVDIDINLLGLEYLQFDWDNNGTHNNNPGTARATFGNYRGDDRIIYWKELFE